MGNEAFEDEDVDSVTQEEAPSGALPLLPLIPVADLPLATPPPPDPPPTAPIDQVSDAAGEDAAALLKLAARYGVGHDDPLWSAVLVLLGSREVAQKTVEAAEKVKSAGKDLTDLIFKQTIRAGDNLTATMSKAATKAAADVVQNLMDGIVKAIRKPFGEGVKAIETVIGAVDSHVEKERAVILSTWRKDLAAAAAREARRRSLVIAAVSWGVILATCGASIAIGAAGMWGGLDIWHKVLPWGLHLVLRPDGTPLCEYWHHALICGVTH